MIEKTPRLRVLNFGSPPRVDAQERVAKCRPLCSIPSEMYARVLKPRAIVRSCRYHGAALAASAGHLILGQVQTAILCGHDEFD